MRLLKSSALLGLFNSYLVDSPQPSNLSYCWNFGSLLATCLGLQIITGVLLAMHYTPQVDLAFVSVEHIMRDVNYGWLLRYTHANVASFFFIFVYGHVARGLYYGSYQSPRVAPWSIGVIMLVLIMGSICPYIQGLYTTYPELLLLWSATLVLQYEQQIGVYLGEIKHVRALKRVGPHNKVAIDLLAGGLLGDMWGTPINGQVLPSVRFGIEQSAAVNGAYLQYTYGLFNAMGYANVPPCLLPTGGLRFYLVSFTSLYWVFTGFYTQQADGSWLKGVPLWIGDYLSPIAVAHWFMQDGSRHHGQGVSFATNGFTYDDCLRLALLLNQLYGLTTSVVKGGKTGTNGLVQWRVSVWKKSLPAFDALVRPHMHHSMLYKLALTPNKKPLATLTPYRRHITTLVPLTPRTCCLPPTLETCRLPTYLPIITAQLR